MAENDTSQSEGVANEDSIQTGGREGNAAQSLNAADDNGGAERYPSVRQDDSVERTGRTEAVTGESRSFDPSADAPTPRQGAGDSSIPPSTNEGFTGPGADPVEGKR